MPNRAINVNMKNNVKDFKRIEERIAQVAKEVDSDPTLTREERDAKFMSVLNHYTGVATGLVWDDQTGKISIAAGYHANENGDVVRD